MHLAQNGNDDGDDNDDKDNVDNGSGGSGVVSDAGGVGNGGVGNSNDSGVFAPEVASLLRRLGYSHSLSRAVLHYKHPSPSTTPSVSSATTTTTTTTPTTPTTTATAASTLTQQRLSSPCSPVCGGDAGVCDVCDQRRCVAVVDAALPSSMQTHIVTAFAKNSSYWREHGYATHPKPSPYFSYIHALTDESGDDGSKGSKDGGKDGVNDNVSPLASASVSPALRLLPPLPPPPPLLPPLSSVEQVIRHIYEIACLHFPGRFNHVCFCQSSLVFASEHSLSLFLPHLYLTRCACRAVRGVVGAQPAAFKRTPAAL
jgi:hypothetical protein